MTKMPTRNELIEAMTSSMSIERVGMPHHHVSEGGIGSRRCNYCGRDLAHDLHLRAGEVSATKLVKLQAEAALNATLSMLPDFVPTGIKQPFVINDEIAKYYLQLIAIREKKDV